MFLVLLPVFFCTRPPILNLKNYVVAYSLFSGDYNDVESFMKNNNLSYLDVNIDTNPDLIQYFLTVYKDFKTSVYYYGNSLGTFAEFKKIMS